MGLFDRKKKSMTDLITQSGEMLERAGIPDNSVDFDAVLLKAFLKRGEITREEAMGVPTFAGCVNKICDTMAIIPIKLYRKTENGVEELPDDDRVRLLNRETGDNFDGVGFKRAMIYDYLTNTGGYAFINKQGNRFLSLNYVDANKIAFRDGTDPIFKDYKISVQGREYEGYQFLKLVRRTKNGYSGKSIVSEANEALGVVYASQKFERKLIGRGGNKKGFLESERKLDKDAINELKEGFNQMYSDDTENAVVLNNGVKFHESSNSSVEMQLNENKKLNATEICKLFGMPPGILTGSATAEEVRQFIQYCIIPIAEEFVEAANRDLLLENEKKDLYFDYDVTELTRADIKTRYEAYAIGYKNRFLQISEIRAMENLPDIDIPFFMLGLNDVLYDPESGDIFIPNMNQWANIKNPSKYPAWSPDAAPEGGEEEKQNESDNQS